MLTLLAYFIPLPLIYTYSLLSFLGGGDGSCKMLIIVPFNWLFLGGREGALRYVMRGAGGIYIYIYVLRRGVVLEKKGVGFI